MPEYLQKRFQNHWVRTYLTAVALISYVFTKFSVSLFFMLFNKRKFVVLYHAVISCSNRVWDWPVEQKNTSLQIFFFSKQNMCQSRDNTDLTRFVLHGLSLIKGAWCSKLTMEIFLCS